MKARSLAWASRAVRQGKSFSLELEGDIDESRLAQIHELAGSLLSNPVIEDYVIREDVR